MFGLGKKKVSIRNPNITSENDGYSFRRSRTMTGSTADNVRSAGEKHTQLRSNRLHTHDLRKHRRLLVFYLASSLVLIALLGWTITQFTASTTVTAVNASSLTKPFETQAYQASLNNYYNEHPFERFRFALNTTTLTEYTQRSNPEIARAEVKGATGIGHGVLQLTLRTPVVAWNINNQRYYVDTNGQTFTKNYFAEPSVTIEDKSGINPLATSLIASSRFLHFTGRVIALVNASGLAAVTHVTLPPNTSREVDLSVSGHPYTIKTQLDRDPAGQATDVVNAIKYLDSKSLSPGYVDVRVSSKAFYR